RRTLEPAVRAGDTSAEALAPAAAELDRLIDWFGAENVFVELTDHGDPLDDRRNDALADLAAERGLAMVATTGAHCAGPDDAPLAAAVAAVRANRSMADLDGWLPAHMPHLRSGAEMAERFARYPGAVPRTVELADELAFPLRSARPALPRQE